MKPSGGRVVGSGRTEGVPPRRLTVFGSTGSTGRKIVELALSRNDSVTVLVRDRTRLGELANRVSVVEGNALDSVAVARAIPQDSDAVLIALGHTKDSPRDLETVALGNIVASMRATGVKRLVLLSNAGVGDSADRPSIGQRVLQWLLKVFMKDVYQDSLGAGHVVKGSDLEWTIARASILTNAAAKGKYHVGPMSRGIGVRISRSDMAEFMVKCATEGLHLCESPYVGE